MTTFTVVPSLVGRSCGQSIGGQDNSTCRLGSQGARRLRAGGRLVLRPASAELEKVMVLAGLTDVKVTDGQATASTPTWKKGVSFGLKSRKVEAQQEKAKIWSLQAQEDDELIDEVTPAQYDLCRSYSPNSYASF